MFKIINRFLILLIFVGSFLPLLVNAEVTLRSDTEEIIKSRVIEIISSEMGVVPGMDIQTPTQKIRAIGLEDGKEFIFENDFTQLKEGQKFYALKIVRASDGRVSYAMSDVYRIPWILFFTILFVLLVVLVGGMPGVRGLVSLIGGLLLIFYVLIPQIVAGYSPLLVSSLVASLMIIVGSYVTHGFNKTTTSAVLGMIITVLFTGVLAFFAVHITNLTGMDSDEATYLALNTRGALNLQGLLLGGIMIGLLGALYDSAIGQSVLVEELWRANPRLSRSYVFSRALRMGREHIGALVDTLAIAYVGVSLPLLVLFSFPEFGTSISLINREMFASEIIRTLVGSIGLVLAVPITTAISVAMLHGVKFKGGADEFHGHHHHH